MALTNDIPVKNKISNYSDLKIAPFDPAKKKTKPHRHNKYFEIVYLSKAEGFHYIDDEAYKIEAPTFFFVKKDAVHHWDITNEPEGYVIIFKEAFLENTTDKTLNSLLFQLINYYEERCEDPFLVENLFSLLVAESNKSLRPNKHYFEGLLKALLSQINKNLDFKNLSKPDEFLKLLTDSPVNNVGFYADKLGVTNQKLNQLCKEHFSKTTTEMIAYQINKEAKRLLRFSSKSVSEIAFTLHFKDTSHFVRYFKKHNETTPLKFRNTPNKPL
ncbi:helix-turn-helix domain-containing protein [Galbibacter sp. BG1]|uniref:helix-turn-helix domain-containing protein n=1 Tax=Galbibacter sp. BG1 TaxID=1170699 RepID=UPI0015C0D4D2|nr:helix-turn-helix transcriptional regulator [Galbibacter sp. BG1]QLE02167.1 helix-turn-helix domain-containing protein [Galbibacter sp. BG1]